jgi:signal transduction histidine kinase
MARPAPRLVWSIGVPTVVGIYAALALAVPRPSQGALLTYAATSFAAHAADLVAGVALIGGGSVVWLDAVRRRVGGVAIVAGLVWFAPDWEGWDRGSELVRSVGAAGAPFLLALFFQLVMTLPRGRRPQPAGVVAIVAVYAVATAVSIGDALFRAPYLDPRCWRDCLGNSFLVHAEPQLVRVLTSVWLWASLAVGLATATAAAWRLRQRGAGENVLGPALVAAALVGVSEAAYAAALIVHPQEDPRTALFASIFLARSVAATTLGIGIAWIAFGAARSRSRVARLAVELGEVPPPGKLGSTLAELVGDSTLEVAYWSRPSRRYLDAGGRQRQAPQVAAGRGVTRIVRGGEPVAVVGHQAALLDEREFEEQIGPSLRLAIDSERLQVEILAQLADLRASRSRIVAVGDSERQRLERNLHDGAQQRLLAVSYELRLARADARADNHDELAAELDAMVDELGLSIADLREFARGLYPAVLVEAGIAAALERLADSAPIPVELDVTTEERFPIATEGAVYVIVAEAVRDAVDRDATFITVVVEMVGRRLVVVSEDDGTAAPSDLTHVEDRVAAAGGQLELTRRGLRAEIPCV